MTTFLKTQHDVIIIGAGAAGLSAGLVLARARADVLLIDAGQPRNAPAAHMHGFVSRDGMPPTEFLAAGRQEVAVYGGSIEASTVTAIGRRKDGGLDVTLAGGDGSASAIAINGWLLQKDLDAASAGTNT